MSANSNSLALARGKHLRTNYVLIDFESVQPKSLAALEHDHFKVIVFVGASQAKVPFEVATALQRMGANAEYVKISGNGKNALDFHIAFYIGQLVAQDPTAYFHIISHDGGFDPLLQYLKSKKVFSARSPSISDIPLVKSSNTKTPAERAQLLVEKLQQPKATKPRVVKTLTSAIGTFFQKQITDAEVAAVIAEMQKLGFITVSNNKVSYVPEG
jgi:hypothetical protein